MMKLWQRLIAIGLAITMVITTPNITYATPEMSTSTEMTQQKFVTAYREGEEMDTSFAGEQTVGEPALQATLASSYSSVDQGYVTNVKYQYGGTCWAHAAISIAETSYIMNEGESKDTVDFNEYHLIHYNNHTPEDLLGLYGGDYNENSSAYSDLDGGGNNSVSLVTFANWIGASNDPTFTHENVSENNPDADAYKDAAHLREAYVLTMPDMSNPDYMADMNVIKQMVMDYGSVAISYFADQQYDYYWNGYQYINEDGANWGTNHAVTVVGWDDTISASCFTHTPPGDGAWLVKNSWSSDWGINGYFWLSYYDTTIYSNAFVYDFVDSENYDNNYSYDGAGPVSSVCDYWGYDQVCGANVFVADSYESLEAIGFYTDTVNSDYEIQIYRGLEEDGLPYEGALVGTYTGKEVYVGFHTLELDNPISLIKGERYAIVVTLKKEGNVMWFPAAESSNWGWITFKNYAKAGESYVGRDLYSLADINPSNIEYAEGCNLRIKAFTNEESETEIVEETGISLNYTAVSMKAGQTLQLNAMLTPENATYKDVVYTSSDRLLVTVDANGLVKVNTDGEIGTATITARTINKKKIATCQVTVEPGPVTSISMITSAEAYVGQYYSIWAEAYPVTAANRAINYTSSDSNILTVDADGSVQLLKAGKATIIATAADGSGVTATCEVTVKEALVESISIADSIILGVGSETTLTTTIRPYYAINQKLKWTSSNTSVATVNEEGIISAKKAGTAIITASATDGSGVTDSCEIIVEEVLVETIYLSYESVTIYKGETLSLYATIQPYNVSNKTLNWRSSNSEVASVDKDGTVIANKVGIAFIIVEATDGSGVKAICEVTVSPVAPISLILETANVTLDIGENVQLYTKIYPENTDDVTLKWTSSNSNVAKVDNNGKITAIAPGTAIITVSTTDGSNLSDSCSIQVKEQDVTKEKTYSITYVLNGGKNHSKNPATYTTSESIKLNTPTRKGYSFKGWYSDAKFKKKVTKITKGSTGNKTLYAKWEKTKYTITYKLNGGKNSKKNPSKYTVTTSTIILKNPTRKGYTFKGWYSDAKFKKKVTKIKKGSTGNIKLYAKWVKKK